MDETTRRVSILFYLYACDGLTREELKEAIITDDGDDVLFDDDLTALEGQGLVTFFEDTVDISEESASVIDTAVETAARHLVMR